MGKLKTFIDETDDTFYSMADTINSQERIEWEVNDHIAICLIKIANILNSINYTLSQIAKQGKA